MRRAGSEPAGFTEDATFDRIERGLMELPFLPSVFLGGFREPLSHPKILDMVRRLKLRGATVEMITNGVALDEYIRLFSRLDLPRMDAGGPWNYDVMDLVARYGLQLAGGGASSRSFDACPFVQKGSMSIRWDGEASPCLPLLHTHSTWLGSRKRLIREHSFSSVRDRSLREIWEDPGYVVLRRCAAVASGLRGTFSAL